MKAICFISTGSMTETPPRPWFATKNTVPSGEIFTSMGRPPTFMNLVTFMLPVSTLARVPEYSQHEGHNEVTAVRREVHMVHAAAGDAYLLQDLPGLAVSELELLVVLGHHDGLGPV